MTQPPAAPEPRTTRRGGLLVCMFGLLVVAVDVVLIALFWHTHTRMVTVMFVPAIVGLVFFLAGLNAVLRSSNKGK
jgi:hypothetical protein